MKIHFLAILILLFGIIFFVGSCKKELSDLNVNPNQPLTVNPDYLFTYAAVKAMGSYDVEVNLGQWGIMNWIMNIAPYGGIEQGKEYLASDAKNNLWRELYADALMNTQELIKITSGKPQLVNKNSIGRILRAYIFHRITDLWGDIPYSEALKGYDDLNFTPKYDSQKSIYYDLMKELKEAASSIDFTKSGFAGATDPIYNGDLDKWKRFANSLRLRLAIRIDKADPAKAQQEITELLNAPMISDNSQSAFFQYNTTQMNPFFEVISNGQGKGKNNPSKFLLEMLEALNDPRKVLFAMPTPESEIWHFDIYAGIPNLLPQSDPHWSEYATNGFNYSKMGSWFLRADVPGFVLTYAEVCFLKSEAALQSWWPGSAQQFYEEGIRASIESFKKPSDASFIMPVITVTDINTYISSVPTVSLEQIIKQKWLSYVYTNPYESFSEYRRTGFPVLTDYFNNPVNPQAIPKRLTYPSVESSLNSLNYNAAAANIGGDLITSKIWWDTE